MTKMFTAADILFLSAFIVFTVAACAYAEYGRTFTDLLSGEKRRTGYDYAIPPYWLLAYVLAFMIIAPLYMLATGDDSFFILGRMFFHTVLVTAVYMTLLTIAAPCLKDRLSATACITLWLLPNFLYFLGTFFYCYNAPAYVFKIPGIIVSVVSVIWTIGFFVTIIRGFAEHRRFKKALFEEYHDVPRDVRLLFDDVVKEMHIVNRKKESADIYAIIPPPIISPAIHTPLAIGFFQGSTRIVLPDKEYSEDELRMIFRHELVHIVRRDSMTKLFLLICKALCWFLPFAGKAAEYAAEDMELSCDEIVLRDQDEDMRKDYGRLILSTASNAAGFTTCLSASAESMKYRLKRILHAEKRSMGLPVITFALILLVFGSRVVTFTVDYGSVLDALNAEFYNMENYELVAVYDNDGNNIIDQKDPEEWTSQLLETRICRIAGRYSFNSDGDTLTWEYQSPKYQTLLFTMTDHSLSFGSQKERRHNHTMYYLDQETPPKNGL